ncbi:MAG TPA: YqiA/YcfP family alpha/beta fold hydrolase, partial [Chlamydiales bacterium]|nr:YqiA/YcfP family alpha/beta fold hydrolase [Chlamydiales bacterium]
QTLLQRSLPSFSFDFFGHGQTGGNLLESSLQQRVEESCAVIEATILRRPFGLIGSSMAGYTAIQLLEKYPISHLVLIVPAVYHVDACTPQFGQGFTEIIRQPKSWLHSDAWDRIKQFTGKLLIIYAENDDIIPAEIVHRLYESAANTEKKELYLVKNSSHRILTYLLENPNEFQKVADSIAEFLTNAYARSAL